MLNYSEKEGENMRKFFQLLAIAAIALNLQCCGSDSSSSSSENPNSELVEKVWDFSKENPEGFTINICNWEIPDKGIAVSYAATQNSFDKEALEKVIDHSLAHDCYVGGWLNPEDSHYYYDSVKLFAEDSLEAALAFGKSNDQTSIYILSKDSTIYLK